MAEIFDLLIIGGGPVGLYANQYALKKGLRTRLIEKARQLGGQLKSIYPENPVYDVGGLKTWKAGKLIDNMLAQTERYGPDYCVEENVREITQKNLVFQVISDKQTHRSHAVLLATGRGIYVPEFLSRLDEEGKREAGLMTEIGDGMGILGKRVVVIGGSQETVAWALDVANFAGQVVIINWRFLDSFAALEASRAVPSNLDILEPFGLLEILGEDRVTGIRIFHVDSGEERTIDADAVLMARGYLCNLHDLTRFGVALERNGIAVNEDMHTSKPGIFAAGDVVYYAGKKRLISTGTDEAAKAVESAEKYIQAIWGKKSESE